MPWWFSLQKSHPNIKILKTLLDDCQNFCIHISYRKEHGFQWKYKSGGIKIMRHFFQE